MKAGTCLEKKKRLRKKEKVAWILVQYCWTHYLLPGRNKNTLKFLLKVIKVTKNISTAW